MATGTELFFNSVKSEITSPQESIVCVLHWQLISSGYKCVGVGDNTCNVLEETEMLPEGWRDTPDMFLLQYKHTHSAQLYTLKIIVVDDTFLVHLWKQSDDSKVATMNVRVTDHATEDYSQYKKALKNVASLSESFKKEIVDEMKPTASTGTSSRTDQPRMSRDDDDDPLRVPGTGSRRPRPYPDWQDPDSPFSIGRGDLDPFSSGMGGMMFDPMRGGRGPRFGMDPSAGLPSRLPPGSIPPGARFDPFGPPGTHPGHRSGPDPDHMKPPHYDDMFM